MNTTPSLATSAPDDDPRVRAFLNLLRAADERDTKAGIAATRELRALGYSVVFIGSKGPGGRR